MLFDRYRFDGYYCVTDFPESGYCNGYKCNQLFNAVRIGHVGCFEIESAHLEYREQILNAPALLVASANCTPLTVAVLAKALR